MKKYEAPSLEVTKLNLEDVIAAGYSDNQNGDEGDASGMNSWFAGLSGIING